MSYTPKPPICGPGWAVQQVGPWVLGHWLAPLNAERVIVCRRLYREARNEFRRFQVLATFAGPPFELDLLLAERTRALVVTTFEESRASVDALIFPLQGDALRASIMRLAAASVLMAVRGRLPMHFPASTEDGIAIARKLQLFGVVQEQAIREHLRDLRVRAGG